MSEGPRTYLDASVLIAFVKGNRRASPNALKLLRENRHFVSSKLVTLETLAPNTAHGNKEEVRSYRRILDLIQEWLPIDDQILDDAIALSSETKGLAAADSIHLALCQKHDAIFANAEKPDRAPNRAAGVRAQSIYVA